MRIKKEKTLSLEPKWYVLEIVITVVIALIISLLTVLLAAFLVKTFSIPLDASPIIAVIIKILSIFVACAINLKRPNNGWMRGAAVGIIYIPLSFIVFSLLGNEFSFGLKLLNDIIVGMVTGVISGIASVNLLRKH